MPMTKIPIWIRSENVTISLSPLLYKVRAGGQKLPPLYKTKGGTHRVLLADSTLTDSIPQSAKKDKSYSKTSKISKPSKNSNFSKKLHPLRAGRGV